VAWSHGFISRIGRWCQRRGLVKPVMLVTLFAFVSDATLQCVELTLQTTIQPLVVRTLPDEDEYQHDNDDDEQTANHTDDDRPPARHRCVSFCSRRANILQVTESEG